MTVLHDDIEADERHQVEVDDFITRNRRALNESIRQSRKELAEGVRSARTIDQIVEEGCTRHARHQGDARRVSFYDRLDGPLWRAMTK